MTSEVKTLTFQSRAVFEIIIRPNVVWEELKVASLCEAFGEVDGLEVLVMDYGQGYDIDTKGKQGVASFYNESSSEGIYTGMVKKPTDPDFKRLETLVNQILYNYPAPSNQ